MYFTFYSLTSYIFAINLDKDIKLNVNEYKIHQYENNLIVSFQKEINFFEKSLKKIKIDFFQKTAKSAKLTIIQKSQSLLKIKSLYSVYFNEFKKNYKNNLLKKLDHAKKLMFLKIFWQKKNQIYDN